YIQSYSLYYSDIIYFFILPTRQTHRSTLFPYTTLFRSVTSQEFGDVTHGAFNDIAERTPELDVSDPKSMMDILDELEPLLAASHSITIPDVPPAEWFDEPKDLPPFGAITVTDEGRVYGLLAPRNVAHRSYQNKRVTVPMGNVDYSRWMNRETIVQGGKRIMTGAITMDC